MKVDLGGMFHLADHHDAVTGDHTTYVRSAHSRGGNKAFRRCVRERTQGQMGGGAIGPRQRLAAAAKACAGVRNR